MPVEAAQFEESNALKVAAEQFSSNNDGDLFLVAAQQRLEEGQSLILLEFLKNPEHTNLLYFVGWDLIKVVFQFMPDQNVNSNECGDILSLICNTCSPREICMSLGELLSGCLTWQKLATLLRLLRKTCEQLVGKVAKIFSSILWSLSRCLRSRENIFDHLSEILEMTLEFLKPLVEKIQNWGSDQSLASEEFKELRGELELFLVGLLEYPLVLLEFSVIPKDGESVGHDSCDRFRQFAETVLEFLGYIECNSFKSLFEYGIYQKKHEQANSWLIDAKSCDQDEEKVLPYVGLGCLAFLVHVENIGTRFVPLVTTGRYSLETVIVYINTMLGGGEVKVIVKGIKLLLAVLNMIESETLDHCLLSEDGEVFQLISVLTKLMTHCEDAAVRRDSVRCFRGTLDRFERRGKYKLVRLLNQNCPHSGLAELFIQIMKEEIARSLQDPDDQEWFIGQNVASLLREVFCIPPRVLQSEHGIVEERSRILSTLNLYRFLLIRDSENKTKIQTMIQGIQRDYLKPLMDAVTLSKARMKTLITEKQDEIKGKVPTEAKLAVEEELFSVATPEGSQLKKSSLQDQLEVLESAILTIDMIDSVLVRIREICEEKGLETST